MKEWHQQTSTFRELPTKEVIERRIAMMERRVAGPLSYVLYIKPIAERFGDRVYEVAAHSLNASGVQVTAEELKTVADELDTEEGRARFDEERWQHIWAITPIRKRGEDW